MSNFDKFYNELNSEQKKAVDILDGPLLVLAGPGTGKTQLLSVRAANIIHQKKCLPENILILTYTNAAAKAMKERIARIVGLKGYDVHIATFHSFANSIILDSEEASNYIQDRIQMTEVERVKAIRYILDHARGLSDIRPFRAPYFYVNEIKSKISALKRESVSPKDFFEYANSIRPDNIYIEEKHIPRIKAFAVVYDLYEKLKQGGNRDIFDERGRYDYDDMIMLAIAALQGEEVLSNKYKKQFVYLMADEFQDTNGAQLKLLFSLIDSDRSNLCCVGDDDQSIYRFQGASIANFRELQARFSRLKTISLKDNYRSAKEIIDLSFNLISEVPQEERTEQKRLIPKKDFKKRSIEFYELSTEEEELCFVIKKIKEFKKQIESSKDMSPEEKESPYNNISVLVRKRILIPKLVDAFIKAGIPYATDGKEDIRSEIRVRQMLEVLEFANYEPKNTDYKERLFYNILISDYLEVPYEEILGFINTVNKKKKNKENVTFLSEFYKAKDFTPGLSRAFKAIDRLKDAGSRSVHTVLMEYIREAGVYRFILKKYEDDNIVRIRELRSLASFINMVKQSDLSNPGITLRDFVDEMRTREQHGMPIQGDLVTMTQDGVRIFTAHGSKGQEFHSVIIPFCLQDASWPIKPISDKIPLPPDVIKGSEKVDSKRRIKELQLYDETRLFYVAVSRAKSNVLFTSSPRESEISSSFISKLKIGQKRNFSREEEILIESLTKSDLKDPFIGTNKILRDIVSDLTLNPTSLNNYLRCKRRFLYYNVLMIPSAKKKNLIFGTAVHEALEHVYRNYAETKRFPDFKFFRRVFEDSLRFQGLEENMKRACLDEFQGLKKYFNKISSNPVMPLGLENKMPVNIDGIIFTGKYDKIEMENEEESAIRVVDYKTGPSKKHAKGIFEVRSLEEEGCDDYLRQLVSYKLLYEKDNTRTNKDYFVSHGVLVFVEPSKDESRKYGIKKGEPTEFKVKITQDMVDEMTGVIKNVWQGIQDLDFEKLPERDNNKCSWCDFNDICWGK